MRIERLFLWIEFGDPGFSNSSDNFGNRRFRLPDYQSSDEFLTARVPVLTTKQTSDLGQAVYFDVVLLVSRARTRLSSYGFFKNRT